jgi:hypothetical protein
MVSEGNSWYSHPTDEEEDPTIPGKLLSGRPVRGWSKELFKENDRGQKAIPTFIRGVRKGL